MELIALWQLVKRRWWLIGLPALVALLVTLPQLKAVVNPPLTYTVGLRLTAAAPPETEIAGVTTPYEDSAYTPWLASEYVVINLAQWVPSHSFAAEVSAVLAERGITLAAEDIRGSFVADSFRSIMVLYVNRDDREEARLLAEAAVTVLQTRNQAYFPQFAAQPGRVVALDEIEVGEVAPPITTRLMPLVRIALGVLAGIGLAVLAEYLDDTLRTRADVEAMGLPVIGEIPRKR